MRLVFLSLGWMLGILLAAEVTHLTPVMWLCLVGMMLILCRLNWYNPPFRYVNIALLLLTLGGLRYSLIPQTSDLARFNNTGGLTIEGVIDTEPDIRDDRTLLTLRVSHVIRGGQTIAVNGQALVTAPRLVDVAYGDRIQATGDLITPGEYDTFSYADYLARQNVFSVMEHTSIQIIHTGEGNPLLAAIINLRQHAKRWIETHLPEPQAGLLTGILIGLERGISPELNGDFQRVGASHIIAISGFNMVIIAALITGVFRFILPKRRWLALGFSTIVIVLYTLLAGANAAVIRAALMSLVLIIGQDGFQRKTYVPASLFGVALIMSLLNPNVLWDVGFQLSFFAVLGLTWFVEPLENLISRVLPGHIMAFLSEPLIVGIAAQIATLPLILLYFGRVSLVALPVNLLVVPVQPYILFAGGAALLLAWLPAVSQVLFWLAYVALSWTIGVIRWFADLPFADVGVYVHPRWVIGGVLIVGVFMLMKDAKPRWLRLIQNQAVISTGFFSGFALILLMGAIGFSRPDGKLHVWWLDVGHSHGVLIETPGGAQILIDGGRFPSRLLTGIGDRIPFTDQSLEMVIITQPDGFDTAALPAVLERYDAKVILTNGQPNLSDEFAELEEAIAPYDVLSVQTGYIVTFSDGVQLEVLHPQTQPELNDSINAVPLVIRLKYGDISFLFTGDLSAEGQAVMLDAGVNPQATVMTLPQHGTRGALDPNFYRQVQPSVVVAQIDAANRRGDPFEGILAMIDVPLLRTDEHGTIHLWTDGKHLWQYQ